MKTAIDFEKLAEAWVREDRDVLDALEPAQRRALTLVAAGAPLDTHPDLDAAFVRGVKRSSLGRVAFNAAGIVKDAAVPDNVIRWVMSDESVDRAGDIIRQNWELENYRRNNVILWGHGRMNDVPIGKGLNVHVEDKRLIGDVEFAVAENEFAAQIYRLAKAEVVKAGSVGFRALAAKTDHTDDERNTLKLGRYGVEFTRSELLEYSPCAVPCNPNAVQAAVKTGAIAAKDAEFAVAWQDPTEREWEKLMRRRARSWVSMSSGAAVDGDASGTSGESGGGTAFLTAINALTAAVRDLTEAREDDAASRRMLARSITDLGSRLGVTRAVDSARPVTDAVLKPEDGEKLLKQLRSIKTT